MAGIGTYMMLLCTVSEADLVVEETTYHFLLAMMHRSKAEATGNPHRRGTDDLVQNEQLAFRLSKQNTRTIEYARHTITIFNSSGNLENRRGLV